MGRAMITGLLSAGWDASDLRGAVRRESRVGPVMAETGVLCLLDPVEAISGAAVIVVAVKPGNVTALLGQISDHVSPDQVVISIAAGVPIAVYEAVMPGIPVIRAMPNTPALVGEGITGIAAGRHVKAEHVERAIAVMAAVGAVSAMDESLLDAVTAVSGTGPAYAFLLAEALTEAAIREGLPRDIAEYFVHKTIRGAGHLLTETDRTPAELRAQVTSPGGTTAAAMHVLEERGFRAMVEDAVRAAAQRSRQLGSGE